jgi:hypothetical protein
MVVTVVMIVIMGVFVAGGTALTGRRRRYSTSGLAVVSAAILPGAQLGPVVRDRHAKLGGERSVVRLPVCAKGTEAGLWSR